MMERLKAAHAKSNLSSRPIGLRLTMTAIGTSNASTQAHHHECLFSVLST